MPEDLNKFTTRELGHLFPILIVNHNPDWKNIYKLEKQNIIRALGPDNILRIEHIGSTAIPGLCAKPTIDILLEIPRLTDLEYIKEKLKNIDYQYIPKPENPAPHMMFARGYSTKGITGQTYHIHIRYSGEWDEIKIRDFLIKNPEFAAKYGDLKRQLAVKFRNDREKYTEGKTDFINRVITMTKR